MKTIGLCLIMLAAGFAASRWLTPPPQSAPPPATPGPAPQQSQILAELQSLKEDPPSPAQEPSPPTFLAPPPVEFPTPTDSQEMSEPVSDENSPQLKELDLDPNATSLPSLETPSETKPADPASEDSPPQDNPQQQEEQSLDNLLGETPVSASDPREVDPSQKDPSALSEEERVNLQYEPTNILVQRTLISSDPNGKTHTLHIKVPVIYKSRSLLLNAERQAKLRDLIAKTKNLRTTLAKAKTDSETILKEWNALLNQSIPYHALLPESPSLPENQSATELNRSHLPPDFQPGRGVSIQNPTPILP